MIKNKLFSLFCKGLFTLLPVYITVYLIFWLITGIEGLFRKPIEVVVGSWYFPGLGLLTGIGIIMVIGIVMQMYIAQYLSQGIDKLISRLPIIGDLYSSIQSLIKYLSSGSQVQGKEVVMVMFNDIELIGIITRTDFSKAPGGVVDDDNMISVYVPMSYQIGGFTVYVPKERLRAVDMSQKEALKWALIGGIDD